MKKRFSHNYSAQVSYTYSDTRGNTSGNGAPAGNLQVGSDMRLELNEGPTDFDFRHNFTVSGTALIPRTHGLNVSWVARALSGSPFSVTNGAVDPDLNGVQAEPLAAADYTGDGSNPAVAKVNFVPSPAKNYQSQRNGARGPGFFEADTRLAYRIGLSGGRRLELAADLFNLTNRTNFAIPTANRTSAQFLLLTGDSTSYTPLKLQVGARVQF
ncbi:MAG: hypothetical protein ABI818_20225 [Acidobacteriota bacterium]